MKKLLITSMAAVAIGLYAKADGTGFISGTSFEEEGVPNAGESYFEQSDDSDSYDIDDFWTWVKKEGEETVAPSADEGLFTVTNVNDVTYPSRPAQWEGKTNNKALAIDTGIPLLRNVNSNRNPTSLATAEVFFDSVVQFTATEAAPTPDSANGDKLMVWLYASDDVGNDNPGIFGETTSTTKLVITAGYGDDQIATNYLTNLEVAPETWHRLTIKALNDIDPDVNSVVPGFEVRLDGELVSGVLDYQNDEAESVTTFPSLMASDTQGDNKIIGVAFDGKGAVDDLVFTTADPFAGGGGEEPEPEAGKVNVSVTINDFAAIAAAVFDGTDVTSWPASYEVEKGSTYNLSFMLTEEYELVSSSPVASNVEGFYTITVEPNSDVTIEIVVQKVGGGSGATVDGTTVEFDTNGEITNITTAFDGKTVSGNLDITKFKAYYVVSVGDNGVLSIKLNQKVAAPFAEELAEGEEVLELDTTIGEGESAVPAVGVRIKTFNGLYYGLGTAAELGSSWNGPTDWEGGTGGVIQLKAAKQGDTRFYKIVVTDIEPAQ